MLRSGTESRYILCCKDKSRLLPTPRRFLLSPYREPIAAFQPRSSNPTDTMSTPVWFITAASSGFGKQIALEALKNGHKVIATARSAKKLEDLKSKGAITMDLDVVQPLNELKAIIKSAQDQFGRIDFLINAAGT